MFFGTPGDGASPTMRLYIEGAPTDPTRFGHGAFDGDTVFHEFGHFAAAKALVVREPDNVLAQIEAAYAHDRNGLEREAVGYYDAAHRLGVPDSRRAARRDPRTRPRLWSAEDHRGVGRRDS